MEVKYINIILLIFFYFSSSDPQENDLISAPVIENPEHQTMWYSKYFLGKFHHNYVGQDGDKSTYVLVSERMSREESTTFFSKLRQPTHCSYRRIIMLEKCGHPDLNVFHLK